ncbi:MAG: YvcK family protein [Candidatus Pacebacteria bacterium]|nr:YvcK family protein [Candidatus Paceibacterota bacterium]MBP9866993.1 YvcK family protein [Candidatus Paceibacterota bacterium]
MVSVEYTEDVALNKHAKEAILSADYIILGPGNYYCSVIPNLIVNGCKDAISNTQAKLIFPVNLTNKQGHTLHWKVSDYVYDIESYLGRSVDIILINNCTPSEDQIMYYKMEEGDGVLTVDDMGNDTRVIRDNLLSDTIITYNKADTVSGLRSFIRHDKTKLREAFIKICGE